MYLALNHPDRKDMELFRVGTSRNELVAEFGQPVSTGVTPDGRKYEKFVFSKGYSSVAKLGRTVFHIVADVLTQGLWEVAATPLEMSLGGRKVAYELSYDKKGRVTQYALADAAPGRYDLARTKSPKKSRRIMLVSKPSHQSGKSIHQVTSEEIDLIRQQALSGIALNSGRTLLVSRK